MTDPVAVRIAQTFNDAFLVSHHTLMRGGAAEPLYEPAVGFRPAQIVFTYDYPASALHEAAHWCLAGAERRLRRDYGYWYVPGPRDPLQRATFFRAEADVQALEAVFARTCGVRLPPGLRESELNNPSAYNTRLHTGLPPTPIANPGLASIKAAAHPAAVDYLYYVRIPGTKRHFFTASESEFLRKVCEFGYACN